MTVEVRPVPIGIAVPPVAPARDEAHDPLAQQPGLSRLARHSADAGVDPSDDDTRHAFVARSGA